MNHFVRLTQVGMLIILLSAMPAHAQQTHSLTIRNGEVIIDGRMVPSEELPASLNVRNIEASFSFVGRTDPVVELNGTPYTLRDGRLYEAHRYARDDERVSVFFRDGTTLPNTTGENAARSVVDDMQHLIDPSTYQVMQQHAQALYEQAHEIRARMQNEHVQEQQRRLMEAAREEIERAALVAQELPRLEVQNYLQDVQRQSGELYDLLVHEWELERATKQLAAEIRNLEEGSRERDQRLEELRERLNESFELKQQNRRREIERLEQQLGGLQERLQRREELREDIIERRLNELIGDDSSADWE